MAVIFKTLSLLLKSNLVFILFKYCIAEFLTSIGVFSSGLHFVPKNVFTYLFLHLIFHY